MEIYLPNNMALKCIKLKLVGTKQEIYRNVFVLEDSSRPLLPWAEKID